MGTRQGADDGLAIAQGLAKKIAGLVGAAFAILIVLWLAIFGDFPAGRLPALIATTTSYLAAVTGLCGWVFLYGYRGVRDRNIYVPSEDAGDDRTHGVGAVIWGVVFMFLSCLFFMGFAVIPIGLWMGWR